MAVIITTTKKKVKLVEKGRYDHKEFSVNIDQGVVHCTKMKHSPNLVWPALYWSPADSLCSFLESEHDFLHILSCVHCFSKLWNAISVFSGGANPIRSDSWLCPVPTRWVTFPGVMFLLSNLQHGSSQCWVWCCRYPRQLDFHKIIGCSDAEVNLQTAVRSPSCCFLPPWQSLGTSSKLYWSDGRRQHKKPWKGKETKLKKQPAYQVFINYIF